MKGLAAMFLTLALLGGATAAWAQPQAAPQAPAPPMMTCPCMMMMQKHLSPEQQKQLQEQMAQWQRTCPMWQGMAAPAPEKKN